MELNEIRAQIDNVDQQLVELFVERMGLAAKVAQYKKENNMPIYVPSREREKLQRVAELSGSGMEEYTRV